MTERAESATADLTVDCPSSDTVEMYKRGTLDEPQVTAIRQHLEDCPTCSRSFASAVARS